MTLAEIEAALARGNGAEALDAALVAHHEARAPATMCALHKLAARFWNDDPAQAAFHRTHAYVYALEAGLWDEADKLHAQLAAEKRI